MYQYGLMGWFDIGGDIEGYTPRNTVFIPGLERTSPIRYLQELTVGQIVINGLLTKETPDEFIMSVEAHIGASYYCTDLHRDGTGRSQAGIDLTGVFTKGEYPLPGYVSGGNIPVATSQYKNQPLLVQGHRTADSLSYEVESNSSQSSTMGSSSSSSAASSSSMTSNDLRGVKTSIYQFEAKSSKGIMDDGRVMPIIQGLVIPLFDVAYQRIGAREIDKISSEETTFITKVNNLVAWLWHKGWFLSLWTTAIIWTPKPDRLTSETFEHHRDIMESYMKSILSCADRSHAYPLDDVLKNAASSAGAGNWAIQYLNLVVQTL
jgi:hypothetical protein